MRPNPTFRGLVFYAVLVTAALLVVLLRPLPDRGATRMELEKEGRRLAALVQGTSLEAPGTDGTLHVTWSPAPGGYRGLVVRPQWRRDAADAGPEAHLAVRLEIADPALLRSPERIPLPAATLYREPGASDLVPRKQPGRLILRVDPAVGKTGGEAAVDGSEVAVDNVLRSSQGMAATAVGRGWSGLAAGGPSRIGPRELRALDLLRRILRVRICDDPAVWSTCRSTALTIAPGPRAATYRVTLTPLGAPGAVAFELEVTAGRARPKRGTLRPLPGASLALAADLFVTPPKSSLEVVSAHDPGLVVAGWRPGDQAWESRRWTIDFEALLAGSGW